MGRMAAHGGYIFDTLLRRRCSLWHCYLGPERNRSNQNTRGRAVGTTAGNESEATAMTGRKSATSPSPSVRRRRVASCSSSAAVSASAVDVSERIDMQSLRSRSTAVRAAATAGRSDASSRVSKASDACARAELARTASCAAFTATESLRVVPACCGPGATIRSDRSIAAMSEGRESRDSSSCALRPTDRWHSVSMLHCCEIMFLFQPRTSTHPHAPEISSLSPSAWRLRSASAMAWARIRRARAGSGSAEKASVSPSPPATLANSANGGSFGTPAAPPPEALGEAGARL